MKKFILWCIIAAAVVCCGADYRVGVLGDIHYDKVEYHVLPDGSNRSRVNKDYVAMWKERTPAMLTLLNRLLGQDVPFVLQLGDFTQGYSVTEALLSKNLEEAFVAVKGFFPGHKLLPVKGNHDVRVEFSSKDKSGRSRRNIVWKQKPYVEKFLPFVAKELGRKSVDSNYFVVHNNDLYIFYDGFIRTATSLNFLKKTLAAHPKVRNVFFISHLPVLACSWGDPGWLLPAAREVAKILIKRNAIILTAHTHIPSLVKIRQGGNTLTQLVVSSIGYAWNTGKVAEVGHKNYEEFLKAIPAPKQASKRNVGALTYLRENPPEVFENYRNSAGFVILQVLDNGTVNAEFYNNDSGKPAFIKKIR